jgi:hypothetical protein
LPHLHPTCPLAAASRGAVGRAREETLLPSASSPDLALAGRPHLSNFGSPLHASWKACSAFGLMV